MTALGGSRFEGRQTGMDYDTSSLAGVNFNTTIAGTERADVILLVGTNLRWEAPLVNTRVRKAIKRGAKVFAIGAETDLTYKVDWLGDDIAVLGSLPERVGEAFGKAERPMVIVGGAALKGGHGAALALVETLGLVKQDWNGFNVVHMAAARMGGLMLGYAAPGGIADLFDAKLTFFLGADEVDYSRFAGFKVYVGHHGDRGAAAADVVLPGASYAEKSGTWVNLEGTRAARRARRVPAGRRARGLGDLPCDERCGGRNAALRQPRRAARGDVRCRADAAPPGARYVRLGAASPRQDGQRAA